MDIFQALLIANSGQAGAFKFTINTEIHTVGNVDFYLPFYNATYVNPIEVDWGDGNVETLTGGTYPKHTYATAGVYQISIKAVGGNEMPAWRTFDLWSSTYAYSNEQIISLDTPMLKFESTMDTNNGFGLFYHCRGLQTICPKLLINNPNLTNLSYAFRAQVTSNSSLISIPEDLFAYTPKVTNMTHIFNKQAKLTTIPTGLFDNCTELEILDYAFNNCALIEEIPEYLFRYNLKLYKMVSTFYGCNKATYGSNVFCDEATEKTTRFANITVAPNFTRTFYKSAWTGTTQITAPTLWDYTYGVELSNTLTYDGGGNNTTSVLNYNDIPVEWK